jgi:nitrite reductase/ring-hydroxylating ferredoxin subunit
MRPTITVDNEIYTLLGFTEDFIPGKGRHYQIDDYDLAVFKVGLNYYAIDNVCPHQGGSLSEGELDDAYVTCPMHAQTFHLTNGENVTQEGNDTLTYRVIERDGKIFACLN